MNAALKVQKYINYLHRLITGGTERR